jgi:hypothetical protein
MLQQVEAQGDSDIVSFYPHGRVIVVLALRNTTLWSKQCHTFCARGSRAESGYSFCERREQRTIYDYIITRSCSLVIRDTVRIPYFSAIP